MRCCSCADNGGGALPRSGLCSAMVAVSLLLMMEDGGARTRIGRFLAAAVRNSLNEFFIVRFIVLELCPGPLEDLDRFIEMIRLSSTVLSFIILENRAWTRKVAKKEVFFFKIKHDLSFIILENRAWTSLKPRE